MDNGRLGARHKREIESGKPNNRNLLALAVLLATLVAIGIGGPVRAEECDNPWPFDFGKYSPGRNPIFFDVYRNASNKYVQTKSSVKLSAVHLEVSPYIKLKGMELFFYKNGAKYSPALKELPELEGRLTFVVEVHENKIFKELKHTPFKVCLHSIGPSNLESASFGTLTYFLKTRDINTDCTDGKTERRAIPTRAIEQQWVSNKMPDRPSSCALVLATEDNFSLASSVVANWRQPSPPPAETDEADTDEATTVVLRGTPNELAGIEEALAAPITCFRGGAPGENAVDDKNRRSLRVQSARIDEGSMSLIFPPDFAANLCTMSIAAGEDAEQRAAFYVPRSQQIQYTVSDIIDSSLPQPATFRVLVDKVGDEIWLDFVEARDGDAPYAPLGAKVLSDVKWIENGDRLKNVLEAEVYGASEGNRFLVRNPNRTPSSFTMDQKGRTTEREFVVNVLLPDTTAPVRLRGKIHRYGGIRHRLSTLSATAEAGTATGTVIGQAQETKDDREEKLKDSVTIVLELPKVADRVEWPKLEKGDLVYHGDEDIDLTPDAQRRIENVQIARGTSQLTLSFKGTPFLERIDRQPYDVVEGTGTVTVHIKPKKREVSVELIEPNGSLFRISDKDTGLVMLYDEITDKYVDLSKFSDNGVIKFSVDTIYQSLALEVEETELYRGISAKYYGIEPSEEDAAKNKIKVYLKDKMTEVVVTVRKLTKTGYIEASGVSAAIVVEDGRHDSDIKMAQQRIPNTPDIVHRASVPVVATQNNRAKVKLDAIPDGYEIAGEPWVTLLPTKDDAGKSQELGGSIELVPIVRSLDIKAKVFERRGESFDEKQATTVDVVLDYTVLPRSTGSEKAVLSEVNARLPFSRTHKAYAASVDAVIAFTGSLTASLSDKFNGTYEIPAGAWPAGSQAEPFRIELKRTRPVLYAAINPNRGMMGMLKGIAFNDLKDQFYRSIGTLASEREELWSGVILDAWNSDRTEPVRLVPIGHLHDWVNTLMRDEVLRGLRLVGRPMDMRDLIDKAKIQTLRAYDFEEDLGVKTVIVYLSGGFTEEIFPEDVATLNQELKGTGVRAVIIAIGRTDTSVGEKAEYENIVFQELEPTKEILSNFLGVRKLIEKSVEKFVREQS